MWAKAIYYDGKKNESIVMHWEKSKFTFGEISPSRQSLLRV